MSSSKQQSRLSFKDKMMKIHRFYGVEIEYLEPTINKVRYVMECEPLRYEGSSFQYRMTRSEFFVNGRRLTKQLDVLSEKCAEILYPLELEVTFSGVVKGVTNVNEIQQRWTNLLPRLRQEYVGEIADNYMDAISKNIADPDVLLEKLKRDVLYALLVPRLFALGEATLTKSKCTFVLPHYKYKSGIRFEGVQEIGQYPDANNNITVVYSGIIDEGDELFKDKIVNGKLFLRYLLDNDTTSMIHFRGLCEFDNPVHNKVEYRITRLKERELTEQI